MNEFYSLENISTKTSLLISNNHYISKKKFTNHFDLFTEDNFRGKEKLFKLINKLNSSIVFNNDSFDIFHPTYYDPYFLNCINGKPFVLTVYDMIHEKFGSMFPSNDNTSANKKLLVDHASKVIAISESTKLDVINSNVLDLKDTVEETGSDSAEEKKTKEENYDI
jgi:hypothetical protein